jgi:hypothetical protein
VLLDRVRLEKKPFFTIFQKYIPKFLQNYTDAAVSNGGRGLPSF